MAVSATLAADEALPATLPVFPLPGALLLPHGRLPLNIFEPRYLNMITDTLGQGRMLGMIQPTAEVGHPVPDDAAIYPVGCAGRIVSFSETEDGRFLITLNGLCRFRVAEELPPRRGYRRVAADYTPFREDLDDDDESIPNRDRFLTLVEQYFAIKGIDADWKAVHAAQDGALVTSLSMLCPFGVGEKQALLEATGTANRGDVLATLMEIAVRESGSPDSSARH